LRSANVFDHRENVKDTAGAVLFNRKTNSLEKARLAVMGLRMAEHQTAQIEANYAAPPANIPSIRKKLDREGYSELSEKIGKLKMPSVREKPRK